MSKPKLYRTPVDRWPNAYLCYACDRERRKQRGRDARFYPRTAATRRISAGVSAYAQNTPVCDAHFAAALEKELAKMVSTMATGRFHPHYIVSVHEVRIDDHNDPYPGRLLLRAVPRATPRATPS